jgi:hypothetical protein
VGVESSESKQRATPNRYGEVIKFNESLKQYIGRIYGSSVNPLIEADINNNLGGASGKNFTKGSLSQVRKILRLKEFNGEVRQSSQMQFDSKVFSIIEADSKNKTNYGSPFVSGVHKRGHSITAMGNYGAEKTPAKSLIASLNSGLHSGQYSERDKRLLLSKVEEKQALSSKLFKSTHVSPSREGFISAKDSIGKNENVIGLNVKELRAHCDLIPANIKYQRKLLQEIETL